MHPTVCARPHKPWDALKQCIRHRRSRMAKVLPSHHYKMPAGEECREIFPGAFGQGARNVRADWENRSILYDTNVGAEIDGL